MRVDVRYFRLMTSRPKAKGVEAIVEGLAMVDSNPNSQESEQRLREALNHKHWMPVEHAARLVGQHNLAGLAQELTHVWSRFAASGAKVDPGCRAKESALTALDTLEWFDPEPFILAVRYVQMEPVYGGTTDTAGSVRQRGLFALLRQHHSQAALYAGELLADPVVDVRVGAADALGQYGGAHGAPLLVHRLSAGDEPRVLVACASALLDLEGAFARELLGNWLSQTNEERREVAALALGQDRAEPSSELLIHWLDGLAWDQDIELGMRALALHRSERARQYLIDCIASESRTRAHAAIAALAAHRYDHQLTERVRAAAQRSDDSTRLALVEKLY